MIIEQRVRDYLAANTGKTVVLEYPERPEASFILAARTGGGGEFVRRATFAIQSYAAALADAAELNETVKKVMSRFAAETNISACRLNSDYEFTDTSKKRYRYKAVYEIYYMED